MSWKKIDEWRKKGDGFLISIQRHDVEILNGDDIGGNRWYVYAYIYPNHAHFKTFSGNSIFQNATNVMPLHCGCSYLRQHSNKKSETCSIQVGADYNHLYDRRFTFFSTQEEAAEVFDDAEKLYKWLSEYQNN